MGRARNSRCRPVGSRAQTAGPVFPHSVRKLRRAQAAPPPPHRPTHLISTSIGTRLMTATGSICRGVPVRRDAPVDPDLSENTDRSVRPARPHSIQHHTGSPKKPPFQPHTSDRAWWVRGGPGVLEHAGDGRLTGDSRGQLSERDACRSTGSTARVLAPPRAA